MKYLCIYISLKSCDDVMIITITLIKERTKRAVQYIYCIMYLQQKKNIQFDVYNIYVGDRPESTSRVIRTVKNHVICNIIVIILYCYVFRQLSSAATTGDERCHTDHRILTSVTHTLIIIIYMFRTITIIIIKRLQRVQEDVIFDGTI